MPVKFSRFGGSVDFVGFSYCGRKGFPAEATATLLAVNLMKMGRLHKACVMFTDTLSIMHVG